MLENLNKPIPIEIETPPNVSQSKKELELTKNLHNEEETPNSDKFYNSWFPDNTSAFNMILSSITIIIISLIMIYILRKSRRKNKKPRPPSKNISTQVTRTLTNINPPDDDKNPPTPSTKRDQPDSQNQLLELPLSQ